MLYFLIGCALFALFIFSLRHLATVSPSNLANAVRTFVGVFSALAGSGLLMAGRVGLAAVAIGAAFMAFRSLRASSAGLHGDHSNGESRVRTAFLDMSLDTVTHEMNGEILAGTHKGRTLSDLGIESLVDLWNEVRRDDPQSISLVEAYLDFRDADWRDGLGTAGDNSGAPSDSPLMDDRTALEILGLDEGASAEDIGRAHRQLLSKLHPDHGGSNYLAAKINEAKAHLLRSRRSP